MTRMVFPLVLLLSFVLGLTPSDAFNRHITEDPTKVLKKYLSLDQKGVRLEASSWQVVQSYVDWTEEPAWGHVVVISEFHIVDDVSQWEIPNGLEAKIPVTYKVLGTMHWESATFVSDPHRESVFFHIKAVEDRWQIADPQLPPHVGQKRLIDFVRWMKVNETEASKKTQFDVLHKQLIAKNEKAF